ncbi:tRNA1(Val) (adenine(37)-N6)-methyltransferase [Amphibacillus cookii]|uniref:tRNA1(Val) (adenine(37)-N6)-methyltransferase n=1 Tax=Amphibacillus cookii TaxID=767787 RepID=UPI00195D6B58|nr:tRNA1(Val) (adenine(37)-N6)-methyltransferase [Amphibacillus cookii]MBM7543142.1 tRNA1(Val) A37 N6-methylase TrmN6 [Amphibacillus cookii]
MVKLYEDERLDFLFTDQSMQIIQSQTVFSYSIDAVLLADFAAVPLRKGKIIDLCSGNGVIPLLMSKSTTVPIIGVEIQARLFDMAERSIQHNQKQEQIKMLHDDLKYMPGRFGNDKFDLVTVNPPYFQTKHEEHLNKNDYLTIARHEILTSLEQVIKVCSQLVKSGGKVAMVHRPGRLVDILTWMRHYKLEPKKIRFVYPKKGKEANILLIEASRDGKADLKLLPPLYVFNEDGRYTEELRALVY